MPCAIPANTTSYVYDSLDQLTRENNQAAGKTWVYTYDNGGNILRKSEYAYTTGTLGAALDTISYGYGDSSWKDLLTSYDGKQLSSDAIGNLSGDGKWTYTWRRGRILWDMSRMVDEDAELFEVVQYRYDSNGRRTGKTYGDSYNFRIVGGQLYYIGDSTGTAYYYAGDDLSQIDITFPDNSSTSLHFTYDELGPMSVTYNGAEYFYLKNAQGDVTGLVNSSGTQVVAYTYDAWGNPLTTTGSMADTLGKLNPFRYRGYVYDTETGLYYLGSRYYNPETGRFISADGYVSTGQGIAGNNMFAYCGNNPVFRTDKNGDFWNVVIGAAFGGLVGAAISIVSQIASNGNVNWKRVGLAAAAGAISGGLAATGIPIGGQILANGIIGAASAGADTYLESGGKASVKTYLKNMATGGITGAFAGALGGSGTGTKHISNSTGRFIEKAKSAILNVKIEGVRPTMQTIGHSAKYYYGQVATESFRSGIKAIQPILISNIPNVTSCALRIF